MQEVWWVTKDRRRRRERPADVLIVGVMSRDDEQWIDAKHGLVRKTHRSHNKYVGWRWIDGRPAGRTLKGQTARSVINQLVDDWEASRR